MLYFYKNNLIDDATLSTNGSNSATLDNVKNDIPTIAYNDTDGSGIKIEIDLGSAKAVDACLITGNYLQGLGFTSCELRGSASTDFSGSTVHTLEVNSDNRIALKNFTEETFRYWELTFNSGEVDISNIFLGAATKIENNGITHKSFTYEKVDNSKSQFNNFGQKFASKYSKQKMISGTIDLINASEFAILTDIWEDKGTTDPIWFILDKDDNLDITDSKYIFSGMFHINKKFQFKMVAPNLYQLKVELLETM